MLGALYNVRQPDQLVSPPVYQTPLWTHTLSYFLSLYSSFTACFNPLKPLGVTVLASKPWEEPHTSHTNLLSLLRELACPRIPLWPPQDYLPSSVWHCSIYSRCQHLLFPLHHRLHIRNHISIILATVTYRTVLGRDLLLLIGILHEIIVRHGFLAETCDSQTCVEKEGGGLCSPGSFDDLAYQRICTNHRARFPRSVIALTKLCVRLLIPLMGLSVLATSELST